MGGWVKGLGFCCWVGRKIKVVRVEGEESEGWRW